MSIFNAFSSWKQLKIIVFSLVLEVGAAKVLFSRTKLKEYQLLNLQVT